MIAAVTRRRSRISVTGPRRVLSNIQKVIFHCQEAFLAFDSYCNRNIHKKERGSSADLRPPIMRTILLLSNNVVDKGFQVIFFFFRNTTNINLGSRPRRPRFGHGLIGASRSCKVQNLGQISPRLILFNKTG